MVFKRIFNIVFKSNEGIYAFSNFFRKSFSIGIMDNALKYIKTANDYKSIPRVDYKIRAGAKTRKAISESGAIGTTINKFRLTVW